MAELVDALALGASARESLRVRVSLWAPRQKVLWIQRLRDSLTEQ